MVDLLSIVLAVVVSINLIISVCLLISKKKGNDMGAKELLENVKHENENMIKILRTDNENLIRIFRETNINIFDYIKEYNEVVTARLTETYKLQREQLKNIEDRINELLKNNDDRLERIDKTLTENMKSLQESNEKKLEQMRLTVDEKLQDTLEKRLNTSFTQVSERLQEVYKSLGEMKGLAGDVGDLKKVLSNIKTRGTWGEVQLGNLLEQILAPEQFKSQVMIDENSTERVDFAVVMPGKNDDSVLLPIDAKYPIEAYQRLIEASEQNDVALIDKSVKEIENAIKTQAKEISKKYIKVPKTTDFAIMYLPIEGLYAEVVKKTELIQSLQRDFRIMVCGPTTLAALLNSLQLGFKTLAIEKRSSEVWNLLSLFRNDFKKFCELIGKTQKKLNEASNTIDDAAKKTRTIERQLSKVDSFAPSQEETIDLLSFGTDAESDESD